MNPLTGLPKSIEYVRVDGATDECLADDEVQFGGHNDTLEMRDFKPWLPHAAAIPHI